MKPDSSFPPFYPDAIPLWLHPDLFDETKKVAFRGCWFIGLYVFSILINGLIIFGPIAIYVSFGGGDGYKAAIGLWFTIFFPGGIIIGLLTWREFNSQVQKNNSAENKSESKSG